MCAGLCGAPPCMRALWRIVAMRPAGPRLPVLRCGHCLGGVIIDDYLHVQTDSDEASAVEVAGAAAESAPAAAMPADPPPAHFLLDIVCECPHPFVIPVSALGASSMCAPWLAFALGQHLSDVLVVCLLCVRVPPQSPNPRPCSTTCGSHSPPLIVSLSECLAVVAGVCVCGGGV